MSIASANDLRATDAARVTVQVPGTTLELLCRAIDPLSLVFNGTLPKALVEPAVPIMASWAALDGAAVLQSMIDHAAIVAPVIDALIIAASVSPRIVKDQPREDVDAIWIEDLRLPTKTAILFAVTAHLALPDAPVPAPLTPEHHPV